jgi:hypothetical protein
MLDTALAGRTLSPEISEELLLTCACALRHPAALEAGDMLLWSHFERLPTP